MKKFWRNVQKITWLELKKRSRDIRHSKHMLKKSCSSKYHVKKPSPRSEIYTFTVAAEYGSTVPKLGLSVFHLAINPKYKHLVWFCEEFCCAVWRDVNTILHLFQSQWGNCPGSQQSEIRDCSTSSHSAQRTDEDPVFREEPWTKGQSQCRGWVSSSCCLRLGQQLPCARARRSCASCAGFDGCCPGRLWELGIET